MKTSKKVALIAAGLVAGLVLGSIGAAFAAAPASTATTTAAGAGYGIGASLRGAGGRLIDVVAKLTGLSVDDVRAKRASGQSIADIAKAEGVEASAVVDEALAVRKAVLDAKVASGDLTQDQADAIYAQMRERLTERVTTTQTGRPSWAGQGRGGQGRGAGLGCGGGACGACAAGTPVTQ